MLQVLLTTIALSFAAGKATRVACTAAKLKLRDCHLQLGKHKVQVWSDKILVQDEFSRSMADLPLKDSEWIEVSVQELGGHSYLEFVAWDAPQGQGEVASKKWYVYELSGPNVLLRLEKLVQRRKHVEKDKYKYDRLEKYGLSVENKKVRWSVAREKGFL